MSLDVVGFLDWIYNVEMAKILESENKNTVYFDKINFRGQDLIFSIKRNNHRQHTYVINQTDTGKNALLRNRVLRKNLSTL